MGKTSIHLESRVRDRLRARKTGNETYNDVVDRLLENTTND